MSEKTHKTIRFKATCGLTASWTIAKTKDGWGITAIQKFKRGKDPFPSALAPFEILDAVYGKRRFPTLDAAEAFARSH